MGWDVLFYRAKNLLFEEILPILSLHTYVNYSSKKMPASVICAVCVADSRAFVHRSRGNHVIFLTTHQTQYLVKGVEVEIWTAHL